MTKYIFHVGPHKTGTTYIQNHLTQYRELLASRSVYYPVEWVTRDIPWCHYGLVELIRNGNYDAIQRGVSDILSKGTELVIISCEDMSELTEEQLFRLKLLMGKASTQIVFYTRRWSELLPSRAQEAIRQGISLLFPEFCAQQLSNPFASSALNFSLPLDRFAHIFGHECVKLISFNNVIDNGQDLFTNFIESLGISSKDLLPLKAPRHSSMSMLDIEVLRALNGLSSKYGLTSRFPPSFFAEHLATCELAAIRERMQAYVGSVWINELAEPFKTIYQNVEAKYYHSILNPNKIALGERLFLRRKKDVHYVKPDYLLDIGAVTELRNLFDALTGQHTTAAPLGNTELFGAKGSAATNNDDLHISFALSGEGASFCAAGWSKPEPQETWALGPESSLALPMPRSEGDYELSLELRPFLHPPKLTSQRITVGVNGSVAGSVQVNDENRAEYSFPIAWALLGRSEQLKISFSTPDAISPSNFGLSDGRVLAFALKELRLRRREVGAV